MSLINVTTNAVGQIFVANQANAQIYQHNTQGKYLSTHGNNLLTPFSMKWDLAAYL